MESNIIFKTGTVAELINALKKCDPTSRIRFYRGKEYPIDGLREEIDHLRDDSGTNKKVLLWEWND